MPKSHISDNYINLERRLLWLFLIVKINEVDYEIISFLGIGIISNPIYLIHIVFTKYNVSKSLLKTSVS